MSFQTPTSECTIEFDGLGTLQGFQYANGVQQFCGIPYASLTKRWTRASLKTSWENNHHDGTILGSNCPYPGADSNEGHDLFPVPASPNFTDKPVVDELSGLVMNIVLPNVSTPRRLPVLVYVHGGSLLYGGANLSVSDGVNLVSRSLEIGSPIVYVNFNYRVGIGGFLASKAIQEELRQDGHQGCGNFGFTDQQCAFQWIQRYIALLGGDPDRVTAIGQSAGGISISNQLAAAIRPMFHRAVCMSGLSVSIPPWTMEEHERYFEAICQYFQIKPTDESALEKLRRIPQQEIANATPGIQGTPSGTGNPCLDGWFYAASRDPLEVQEPPEWLESLMLGDVYHEGIIFHLNLLGDDYNIVRNTLKGYVCNDEDTDYILQQYGITPELEHEELLMRVEHMCGDAVFKIPNYATAKACQKLQSRNALFKYHFDQRSRLNNLFKDTSHHAHELIYLFGNLDNEMNEQERQMSRDLSAAWIRFVNKDAPWTSDPDSWMVWGRDCIRGLKTEGEEEETRSYERMQRLLELGNGQTWKKWLFGVDALVNKRANMGRSHQ